MHMTPLDTNCCICLDTECNYLTDCCKNKIHKSCLVNWFVYKAEFNCPLCRNTDTRLPINYLLNTPIVDSGLTPLEVSANLNKLLRSYNLSYNITIEIPPSPQPQDNYSCVSYVSYVSLYCYRFRAVQIGLSYRVITYLLLISLFYFLLFLIVDNYHIAKYNI
jgi:hypothetical protein